MANCEECGAPFPEKHHVVFKSQGGINHPINYKKLCLICHKGDNGPHKNRVKDLEYKLEMQNKLYDLFRAKHYNAKMVQKILKMSEEEIYKILKTLTYTPDWVYKKEDIIRKLMGGKLILKLFGDEKL